MGDICKHFDAQVSKKIRVQDVERVEIMYLAFVTKVPFYRLGFAIIDRLMKIVTE